MLRSFYFLCGVFLSAAAAASNNHGLGVEFKFDAVGKSLGVVVKNESTRDIAVHDSLTQPYGRAPGYLFVSMFNKDKRPLGATNPNLLPGGYFTPRLFDSQLVVFPVAMTTLRPHQSISTSVKLETLLGGIEHYLAEDPRTLAEGCFKFKLLIYLDKDMSRFTEEESPLVCID